MECVGGVCVWVECVSTGGDVCGWCVGECVCVWVECV